MGKNVSVILEPDEMITLLEKTQYETEAHKDLLTWMLHNGYDMSATYFKKYHDEYEDLFVKYQQLKKQFEEKYVRTNSPQSATILSWYLDFQTKLLTIKYDD